MVGGCRSRAVFTSDFPGTARTEAPTFLELALELRIVHKPSCCLWKISDRTDLGFPFQDATQLNQCIHTHFGVLKS